MRVGDPLDPATEMGAQISPTQVNTILGYIRSGREQGAKLLAGGEQDQGGSKAKGNFLKPTGFGDVKPEMKTAQEGICGPVIACIRGECQSAVMRVVQRTTLCVQ